MEPVPPRPADEDEKDAHDEEDDGPRVSMPELMTFLDSKKIADLPDGGGLASM